MRKPNSYGSVEKLSSKRRKPYGVRVTTGWEIVDGKKKQIRKYLGYYATRKEAEIALAEYNQNPYDLNQSLIFSDLYEQWSKKKYTEVSKSAVKAFKASYNYLAPLHDRDIREIKTDDIQHIIDNCDKSYATKANIKQICKQIMEKCVQNDVINRNYAEYVNLGKKEVATERVPFSLPEIAKLHDMRGDMTADLLLILIYTGMRINELLSLNCKDVDLTAATISINESKTEAGVRTIPIHSAIYPIIEQRYKEGAPLIRGISGHSVSYNNLTTRYIPAINQILGSDHKSHDCRVTFISRWKELQLDSLYLKKIVGHKPSNVTDSVYTKIKMETLAAELEKLTF